ncbi:MAG: carbon monoxide dehydrogenase [Streptosporangiales bacterium]|nr:carbon monoxide dehydrogenase [Streptosporangiales bacterium]
MKPAPFGYTRPRSVAEVLDILRAEPDAKVLAGGQSLLAVMNLRLARPARLVDLGVLRELDRVFDDDGAVLVGALCTHRRLETDPLLARRLPLLAAAARQIGHVSIRNRGTLGGSLAHADPAAELPAAMVALDATCYVEARDSGRRAVPARDFFESSFTTAMHDDELLTWVRIPTPAPEPGWGFAEVARRHGDFASAGAVTIVHREGDRVGDVTAVLFGVGDRPVPVDCTELAGTSLDDETLRAFAHRVTRSLAPAEEPELRRRHAAASLARALTQAATRRGPRRQDGAA